MESIVFNPYNGIVTFFREKIFTIFFPRVKIKLDKIILTINFIHSTIVSHNHPWLLDKICTSIFTLTSKLIILLLLLIFYNIFWHIISLTTEKMFILSIHYPRTYLSFDVKNIIVYYFAFINFSIMEDNVIDNKISEWRNLCQRVFVIIFTLMRILCLKYSVNICTAK